MTDKELLYREAVSALDRGDIQQLEAVLDRDPSLVEYRCRHGEWYESGYFQGAALLHHVAGNPIRCPLPPNIVDVARLLLERGADPNATTDNGSSTVGLILTSKQVSDRGLAGPLIDVLCGAGAQLRLEDPDVLSMPLLNQAPATAHELIRRGAQVDARHAAGLGRLDDLDAFLKSGIEPALRDEALVFACIRGQQEAARILVARGAKADVLMTPGGQTPRTALHEAANRGYLAIVRLLIENDANTKVVEPRWGGTPAGWATHGGHPEIAMLLDGRIP